MFWKKDNVFSEWTVLKCIDLTEIQHKPLVTHKVFDYPMKGRSFVTGRLLIKLGGCKFSGTELSEVFTCFGALGMSKSKSKAKTKLAQLGMQK